MINFHRYDFAPLSLKSLDADKSRRYTGINSCKGKEIQTQPKLREHSTRVRKNFNIIRWVQSRYQVEGEESQAKKTVLRPRLILLLGLSGKDQHWYLYS